MVNFNLRLHDNMFGEWKHEYIDYRKLKHMLKKQQTLDADLSNAASAIDVDTTTTSSASASASEADQYGVMSSSSYDNYQFAAAHSSNSSNVSFLRALAPHLKKGKAVDTSEMQTLLFAPAAFEDALDAEYEKVERAYSRHATHFAGQLALLRGQYRHNAPHATQESLKNSLVELYRLLNMLNNFALLNYTGFVKILKKHDKVFPTMPSLRHEHKLRLQSYEFAEARKCRDLLRQVEQMFADLFCEGNKSVAIATLMTKREDFIDWAHIYIGIKIGTCLILIVWVVWDSLVVPTFRSERERRIIDLALTKAYPVYRGIGCLLLLHWLIGISLYVWRKARINYRYIFELDPRNTQQYAQVFSDATNMTIVFLVNVLLYYKVVNGYFPEEILHRGYYPLMLCVYAFYFYVLRNWRRQRGLLRTVLETVCSPFYAVTFFHTFVGDYMTSVVKVNQDLCWSLCFFATREFLEKDVVPDRRISRSRPTALRLFDEGPEVAGAMLQGGCSSNFYYVNVVVPLICALPLWWRFLQSLRRIYDSETWWPNLPNAFKYALAQVVALFGIFHPFYGGDREHMELFRITWIVLFTLSSLYTWVWDVTMDWGLGRPEFKFLGDRQMFSRKWVYYLAIVADLFLRFAWMLTLVPPNSSGTLPLYLQPFTMVAELFRRTFWSFFRLENEHLRNTQGFRRVDFIPLHYDHGVGEDLLDDDNQREHDEPLAGKVFLMKILLIIFLVLGLSIAAIVIEKYRVRRGVTTDWQRALVVVAPMTNFTLRLHKNIYGEWKDEYIDYTKLSRIIKHQQQQQHKQSQDQAYRGYGTATHSPKPMGRLGVRRSRSTSFLHTLAANATGDHASETQGLVLQQHTTLGVNVTSSHDPFEDALEREYDKVERAYVAHVTHYTEQLELLRVQFRPRAPHTTRESLKFALGELHRLLHLLSNFTLLNYKGFVKVLKKHEKAVAMADVQSSAPSSLASSSTATGFLLHGHKRALQSYAFAEARQCHDLLHQVEQTFADFFCDGNHALAVATLMTKREEPVNWAQIYIGIKIGACLILIMWVVWDSLVVPAFKSSRDSHVIPLVATRAYPVYRGIGCLLLLHWLIGISLYVWRKARINYRYIFELDPRNTQQYAQVFSDATNMTIVFLVNVLLYYKVVNGNFPEDFLHRGYYPLMLFVYTFYYYVVRNWERQCGMLRTILEIMASPFSSVTFFHVFVGNYLTSTIKVNQDLSWAVCYFATSEFLEKDVAPEMLLLLNHGVQANTVKISTKQDCQHNFYYVNVVVPLICALPLWWRFLQNLRRIIDSKTWWPNLPNAFKYALAQVVALFGIFHPFYGGSQDNAELFQVIWIVLFTLSSLYTWVWDVTMDWGLGRPEHKLRGYRQMFSRNWIYYAAVVADFFLCFAWTLSLIPHRTNDEFLLYLQPFTMVAELFRRTFWSFFCLENEHLRNTHGYRRVNFIPLHYDMNSSDDGNDLEPKDQSQQQGMEPLGGLALLTNIALLVCAVVGLSFAAIVFEK